MKKNILVVAIASAMIAPLAAQAELKLSGDIQFEVGSLNAPGDAGNDDRKTVSSDSAGALAGTGGGPNKIRLDFDEKLSAGLDAFGRVDWSFNTANSTPEWQAVYDSNGDFVGAAVPPANSTSFSARETFLGLKGSGAHIKFGRIEGVYKSYAGLIDPLYSTAAQARAFRGGMTGGTFGHGGFLDNIVEVGYKTGGFDIRLQGMVEQDKKTAAGMDDQSAQLGLGYNVDNWGVFAAGTYHSFTDNITEVPGTDNSNQDGNAKVGGYYKTGGLKLGLQYELAGDTSTTIDHHKGDYALGTAAYTMGNVTIAGWVAGYMADNNAGYDAMSYALAAIYSFSPRTMTYLGLRITDADLAGNNADWDAIAAGIRHSF